MYHLCSWCNSVHFMLTSGLVALQLLGSLLEEGDDISQRLLDTILKCLVAPQKDDNPAAYRCAFGSHALWQSCPILFYL